MWHVQIMKRFSVPAQRGNCYTFSLSDVFRLPINYSQISVELLLQQQYSVCRKAIFETNFEILFHFKMNVSGKYFTRILVSGLYERKRESTQALSIFLSLHQVFQRYYFLSSIFNYSFLKIPNSVHKNIINIYCYIYYE